MHTYIHTYVYTYIPNYIHTYTHTHTHIYIYTYIYIHTYIHTYIQTDRQTNTHIHTYIHTEGYYITRGNAQIDAPQYYRKWNHPAKAIELKEKCEEREYTVEVYMGGSKSSSSVDSGIAIFMNKHLTFQLKYKVAERCSNNQVDQLAIAKALEEIQNLSYLQGNQRSAAIHTDSKITLDAIANPRNHKNLVEQIRDAIRWLENDNWTIHFAWVKAHNDTYRNELADQLGNEAARGSEQILPIVRKCWT